MSSTYELLPIFCIRLAGRPFDHLEKLRLGQTLELAREVLRAESRIDVAARESLVALKANPGSLTEPQRVRIGNALGRRLALPEEAARHPGVGEYQEMFSNREALLAQLKFTLEKEFQGAREALIASVSELVKPFLVFSSAILNEQVDQILAKGATCAPDSHARKNERHLLMYLQRICAKNDTVSEFGPTAWGRVDPIIEGMRFSAKPGIARREVYLEKWAVDGIVAAMNNDPDVRPELAPRPHPNGRVEGDRFIREDSGVERVLSSAETQVFSSCNGTTAAWQIGSLETLATLAEAGVLIWKVEAPVLDPHRMEQLAADLRGFRPGLPRDRWLTQIERLLSTARAFGASQDTAERWKQMQSARDELGALKIVGEKGRELYSANNPIGEECARDVEFVLGKKPAQVLVEDAAPWLDLWCDSFAYAASKWGERVAQLYRSAPRSGGRVLLPSFLSHCNKSGLPINGASSSTVCGQAFAEVRQLLTEELAPRSDAEEWELTREECHVVRRKLKFTAFGEMAWPSAELVLSAASPEAIATGDYQWVIGELHAGLAVLHHAIMWACPERQALGDAYRRVTAKTPFFYWGQSGADVSCHTVFRAFEIVPDLWTFASANRAHLKFPSISPTRVEVVVDERGPDVRARSLDDGRDLGSFVRHWAVGSGLHPFLFVLRPHMPRLRMGKVIVQRQFWSIALRDLSGGPFEGLSGRLVIAIERLRAEQRLPRFVFARPSAKALNRTGDAGRDKDVKPIFIDLESYHSMEVFRHALAKHKELELSEMLPAPDQMMWREAAGRYTYELRTLIGPAKATPGA